MHLTAASNLTRGAAIRARGSFCAYSNGKSFGALTTEDDPIAQGPHHFRPGINCKLDPHELPPHVLVAAPEPMTWLRPCVVG